MWSLGTSLKELLFGILPFYQENANHSEINMNDRDLSQGARDVILKLLESNATKRIEATAVLHHPLMVENRPCTDY